MSAPPAFQGWSIVELMGHRRMAGHASETTVAGAAFLRLDVPSADGTQATQFYSPSAIYCITPTTEDIARALAQQSDPAPVTRWELERGGYEVEVVQPDSSDSEPWS